MKDSANILLWLVRVALNGKVVDDSLPSNVNWLDVMRLSQTQGIRGLVYEALETIKKEVPDVTDFPDKELVIQSYVQTLYVEKRYAKQFTLAQEISDLWKRNGLKTIVFKGFAHSRYYPKPEHREFGDFDCYLLDSYGRNAYSQGNDIARKNGMNVDDSWYKHSHILYKTLTIENHQFFTSARRGGTDKLLHQYIVKAIGDGSKLDRLTGTDIYVLPVEAEGLFMLYHSLTHFLVEGINLRHFVDWACWIRANQDKIQWANFYADCKHFRLDGFVDVLNTIAVKYLGVELHDKAIFADSEFAEKTIASALYDDSAIYNRSKGRWYERIHVISNAFKYSWKYRDVAHVSMVGYIWQFVYGFIYRREEN